MRGWSANDLPFLRRKGNQDAPKTERDFMGLNRAAVQAGLTTASEHYQFRGTHDVRRKLQSEEGRAKMVRRLPPSMVYGISTRCVYISYLTSVSRALYRYSIVSFRFLHDTVLYYFDFYEGPIAPYT